MSVVAGEAAPRRSIGKTALALLPMQIVFRGGEALLPLLIALWFGRNAETDLYFLAAAFFTFSGSMLGAAFQDSALVPILADLREKDPALAPRVAGSLLVHALVFGSAFAAVIGMVALGWAWTHVDRFDVASTLVLPLSAWIVALGARSFFGGLLAAHGRYFAQPIATGTGMAVSLAIIAWLHRGLGIAVVPIGSLIAELVAIGILAYAALVHARLPLALSLARPEPVRRFFGLVAATVAGATITRINPMVDQLMSRLVGTVGGGTLLRLTSDVSSVPTSLAQAALFSVLLTQLSQQAASRNTADFENTLRRALFSTCALLAAASFVLALLREPLLRLVFLHGEMDEAGVLRLTEILPYALIGVPPFGALLILAVAHVALQNNRVMIPLGILNAALNLALDWLLVGPLGLRGIALATSIMHGIIAATFFVLLRARLRAVRAGA
jgi:putative peptidoglycan lipid II flippase